MKVSLKIFLPDLAEVIGSKEVEVEFAGGTVIDFIDHLITRYGHAAKQALFDESGSLDPMIQVFVNGEAWVAGEELDETLKDGDELVLMLMMAGG